jgi:hypothetical protein
MKIKIKLLSDRPFGIPRLSTVVCAAFFGSLLAGFCQNRTQAPKQEIPLSGYLSKSAPSGLRFAAPPKPPVAYLPPLPITYDPQPVYSPDFASPIADLPRAPADDIAPPTLAPTSVPVTDLITMFTNKQGKIPQDLVEQGIVNPQMLVRFFQNGKASEIELREPISFKVPVKDEKPSSSASYQVK